MAKHRVMGVDACRAGWVGIVLTDDVAVAHFGESIATVVADAEHDGAVTSLGIDIPIGLPDESRREADRLASAALGPRRATVFLTPIRSAMAAPNLTDANRISRQRTGLGVSAQAFALRAKVLEVDDWLRGTTVRVVEVHPELSFAYLAGAALTSRKATWAGAAQRRRLLADAGIELPDDLGLAGAMAGVDDVLDAAAVAWSARRVATGDAQCLPDPPERFGDGLDAAIWT